MGKQRQGLKQNIGTFLRRYEKKSQPGREPNDRKYDVKIEHQIKRLMPEKLDRLMRGEDEVGDSATQS